MTADRIERSIEIAASAERVWPIVCEPGWWINDGTIVAHRISDGDDGTVIVHDDTHGAFRLRVEKLDAPHYAAFRWIGREDQAAERGSGTLTEFWLEETTGGVVLRVVESGLDQIAVEQREAYLKDNTEGWETELAAARTSALT